MSHVAYFYFAGQSITLLFARWWLSLLVVSLTIMVDVVVKNHHVLATIYRVDSMAALFGWMSTFYVSEFVIKRQPIDFVHNAKLFRASVLVVFQLLIFLGILSLPLLFFEPTILLFVAMAIVHALGMIPIAHMGYLFAGTRSDSAVRFYFFWTVLSVLTDIAFMILFGITEEYDVVFWTTLALGFVSIPFSVVFLRYRHWVGTK